MVLEAKTTYFLKIQLFSPFFRKKRDICFRFFPDFVNFTKHKQNSKIKTGSEKMGIFFTFGMCIKKNFYTVIVVYIFLDKIGNKKEELTIVKTDEIEKDQKRSSGN